ncbi:MAG TPA: O-antigen ligase family protein [Sphingomonas sp.]|jgi:O-antigen ligase|uniref:O-antigen ligase family protein n=1 Tax=Sphingomonas sp. TaxID=28214 RepID=UPI002ED99F0A
MSANHRTLVPVADAPIVGRVAEQEDHAGAMAAVGTEPIKRDGRQWLFIVLLWLNVTSFMGVFSASQGALYTLGVTARYLLWPFILLAIIMHISTRGVQALGSNLILIMPFFAIGVVAGLLGYDIITSMRLLTFWLLGAMSAVTIALELPTDRVQRTVFWIMMAVMGGSLLAVFVAPGMAVGLDTRGPLGGGSWIGVFAGKNALGWFAGYALIFSVLSPGIAAPWRLLLAGVTAVCLFFSGSQGSIVIVVATAAFVGVIWLLRRTSLSPGARAGTLLTIVLLAVPLLMGMSTLVLQALGRDTTLTGRTDIWRVFLDRALDYWVIGAGPGSFTNVSIVTIDLSSALTALGMIRTPHNMFIAVLGETGIAGLIAYVAILGYVAFVVPFRFAARAALPASAVAFSTMIGGIGETREVFGPAFAMFLVLLMLTLTRKGEREAPSADAGAAAAAAAPPERVLHVPVLGR